MDTFPLFPLLPKELRIRIWEFALDLTPRITSVYTSCFEHTWDARDRPDTFGPVYNESCSYKLHQFIPVQAPLSLSQVNDESRTTVLQRQQLQQNGLKLIKLIATRSHPYVNDTCMHSTIAKAWQRRLYFDPQRDVLRFHHYSEAVVPTSVGRVRYVCTPQQVTAVWLPTAWVVQCSRVVMCEEKILRNWLDGTPSLPDMSSTELLLVLAYEDVFFPVDLHGKVYSSDEYWTDDRGAKKAKTCLKRLNKKLPKAFLPKKRLRVKFCRSMEEATDEIYAS